MKYVIQKTNSGFGPRYVYNDVETTSRLGESMLFSTAYEAWTFLSLHPISHRYFTVAKVSNEDLFIARLSNR